MYIYKFDMRGTKYWKNAYVKQWINLSATKNYEFDLRRICKVDLGELRTRYDICVATFSDIPWNLFAHH